MRAIKFHETIIQFPIKMFAFKNHSSLNSYCGHDLWSNALYMYYTYTYNYLLSLDYFILTTIMILLFLINCVYPNPLCQLSLWEETGAPWENPRLSAERWPTLFTYESEYGESNPRSHSEEKGDCSDDCANYMDDVLWKNEKRRWRILLQKYFAWIWGRFWYMLRLTMFPS